MSQISGERMAGIKKESFKYSQFDEEFILKDLFGAFIGRCADIGAREKRGSNVARLIEKKWWAQLIDRNINGLNRDFPSNLYPRVTRVHAAVTPENVAEILWSDLDLLSIDIDGPDCEVWEAIPHNPRVVVIEVNGNEDRIRALAEQKGYSFHAKTGVNLIFVHETDSRRLVA